jgi:hypothetical protein
MHLTSSAPPTGRQRRRLALGVAVAAAVASIVSMATTPADAVRPAAGWGPPTTLSTPDTAPTDWSLSQAENTAGDAVVFWRDDDTVYGVRRAAGGGWSDPQVLDVSAPPKYPPYFWARSSLLDPDGTATVMVSSSGRQQKTITWSPDGTVTTEPGPGVSPLPVNLLRDPSDGGILATYWRRGHYYFQYRAPGTTTWTPEQFLHKSYGLVAGPGDTFYYLLVHLYRRGEPLEVVSLDAMTGATARVLTMRPGCRLDSVHSSEMASIAGNGTHHLALVWRCFKPHHHQVTIRTRQLHGSHAGPIRTVDRDSRGWRSFSTPEVSMRRSGITTIAWGRTQAHGVAVRTATVTTKAVRTSTLARTTGMSVYHVDPYLTVDPSGSAVVAYRHPTGWSALVRHAGTWSRSTLITRDDPPDFLVDPAGAAIAVWVRFDDRAVRARVHEPSTR